MTREKLIRNLKYTMQKHENDVVGTFGTNISLMCKDVLDYLEQEPKTGHWVKKSQYGNDYCSECDYELLMCGKPKFCPNCGAKMESEET